VTSETNTRPQSGSATVGVLMPDSARTLDVSVVVCSHNGAVHLPAVLASLHKQTLAAGRFETLVVDDGSSDPTSAIAAEHGARVITLDENCGLAAARNAGVRAARAEIVAFTDDDCVCDPGWLEQLLEPFSNPAVLAVGGGVTPGGPNSFNVRFLRRRNPLKPLSGVFLESPGLTRRLAIYLRDLLLGAPRLAPGERLYSVVGANMAFRRGIVYELGGFDEAFRFGGEEEELCVRTHARREAAEIAFAPRATVSHTFSPRVGDTLRRSRAYGRGNARLAAKYGDHRPVVFPAPLLVAATGVTAQRCRSSRLALIAGLAPLLAYPRWVVDLAATSSPEPFAYPYLQLAQELLAMVGQIEGRRTGYHPVPATQLADAPDLIAAPPPEWANPTARVAPQHQ
jgi:GT2 family glycosyltransferase